MKNVFTAFGIFAGVAILCTFTVIVYFYVTNRTIDQTLAENLAISERWTELVAQPELTAFRRSQELAISIPDYTFDRGEKLPHGQIRLPDGRIASPEVEGVDVDGNTVPFRFRGHTLSTQDLIVYTPADGLGSRKIARIRIRSNEAFAARQLFWRNRNPK